MLAFRSYIVLWKTCLTNLKQQTGLVWDVKSILIATQNEKQGHFLGPEDFNKPKKYKDF